jgi:hypothetical protein
MEYIEIKDIKIRCEHDTNNFMADVVIKRWIYGVI